MIGKRFCDDGGKTNYSSIVNFAKKKHIAAKNVQFSCLKLIIVNYSAISAENWNALCKRRSKN